MQTQKEDSLNLTKPLVSVVVPCYNHEEYIQGCISSIIAQDYDNIELIIIDDGSKDRSNRKIQELIPECTRTFKRFEFRSRENKGLCETLNEALEWCNGEYFTIVASDDMIKKNKLSLQVDKMSAENSDVAAMFSGYEIVDAMGNISAKVEYPLEKTLTFSKYYGRSWLCASSALLRMTALRKTEGYDNSLPFEDLDMWIRLLKEGYRFTVLRESLLFLRKHDNNFSNNRWAIFKGELKIYWKHNGTVLFPLAIFASLKRYLKSLL
ncbi:glycosyl transferase family 2 [Marinobacter maroccanus]|uniref:Glycosyl transferase family 2 n=1 Tax=Marinobacter maroccanus TaxID=2055143 RepID=A0A2S5ZFB6_9GAMM|nr:glycosyltransferase family A protein [Marinobacter maroccanus]PPI86011.1 glycosyl transferase family 2 [Marinobacter maroccanus]